MVFALPLGRTFCEVLVVRRVRHKRLVIGNRIWTLVGLVFLFKLMFGSNAEHWLKVIFALF